jgi:hypothetical protein
MWRRVVCWVAIDISEEHIASIFRVEEIISARTSQQAGGKQNQSQVTTDGQPVSQSGAHDHMFGTVWQLLFCQSGAPSDEGSGLSFVIVLVRLMSAVNRLYIYNYYL